MLEKDEERDHDRQKDLRKAKFTFTECIIALVIALTLVSMHAVFLVEQIEHIIYPHSPISDAFLGLVSIVAPVSRLR